MSGTASRAPRLVLLDEAGDGVGEVLMSLPLAADGRDEAWLRDLLLAHPETLPLTDLDPAAEGPAVPLAREMNTAAGPVDAVFVDRRGLPVLVECKLFRNPQARREVVGQILDYAKELASWSYDDLQREVSRARRRDQANGAALGWRPGEATTPYDAVRVAHPATDEAAFADAVTRNLRTGRFLLVIAGDGIRENVEAIAQYLIGHAGLRFTLGLVEVSGWRTPDGRMLVMPRVLARTREIERDVDDIPEYLIVPDEEGSHSAPVERVEGGSRQQAKGESRAATAARDKAFWLRYVQETRLDDPQQAPPRPRGLNDAKVKLATRDAWLGSGPINPLASGGAGVIRAKAEVPPCPSRSC